MAGRSTRNKIRGQVEQAIKKMDDCMGHLQACEAMADEKSTFINEHLPGIVVGVQGLQHVLKQYYDML